MYLLVRSRKIRIFGGIDLHSDAGWAALKAAVAGMAQQMLGAATAAPRRAARAERLATLRTPAAAPDPEHPRCGPGPARRSGMTVYEALASRRSVRDFLPTPVSGDVIRRVLEAAARAPSGGNVQPWHIDVVAGEQARRTQGR